MLPFSLLSTASSDQFDRPLTFPCYSFVNKSTLYRQSYILLFIACCGHGNPKPWEQAYYCWGLVEKSLGRFQKWMGMEMLWNHGITGWIGGYKSGIKVAKMSCSHGHIVMRPLFKCTWQHFLNWKLHVWHLCLCPEWKGPYRTWFQFQRPSGPNHWETSKGSQSTLIRKYFQLLKFKVHNMSWGNDYFWHDFSG